MQFKHREMRCDDLCTRRRGVDYSALWLFNVLVDAAFTLMSEYRGHHSYRHSVEKLRHSLLAMPRQMLTRSMLSEKNW